ncbi:unnamed protein product [Pedinophyceae sp. YPF-701]|nr:unnamed protein product [Pedinophyceae sp. YPF-701]
MAVPAASVMQRAGAAFVQGAKATCKRLHEVVPVEVVDDIFGCAIRKQTGVSLKYMLDFGSSPLERQMVLGAQFLHQELPIRIAHRIAELENLPYGLSDKAPIVAVRDMYVSTFRTLRASPPVRTTEDERRFTDTIRAIYEKHAGVVPMMAMGVSELRRELSQQVSLRDVPEIHQFLDGFYLSRIGIRMLIGQHIALHEPPRPGHIGLIDTKTNPIQVAEDAIADAREMCMREYGCAPEVEVFGPPNLTFPYVPGHLHHMLFELVKNSLRAVQDRFEDADFDPPPIRVVVAEGSEDITIKVSDEGGGIPRSGLPRIWTYLYTTARTPVADQEDAMADGNGPVVLAGYGYGLPISRLYARYFGGDLSVLSMEGYGTDAYLHLCRLGDKQEPLP